MNIRLDNVTFRYRGNDALRDVSATIESNALTCLLGSNASGKSTLLSILSGESQPASGRLLIEDKDVRTLANGLLSSRFATIPQGIQTPPHLTVKELVGLGRFRPDRSLWWSIGDNDRRVIEGCLRRCQVEELADRPAEQLSGGEKQRVWLAFCLAQEKEFLLLDESLDALDFVARRSFFRLIGEVIQEGRGVLLVTHDLGLAAEFAGKIIILDHGQLIYDGPPRPDLPELISINGGRHSTGIPTA